MFVRDCLLHKPRKFQGPIERSHCVRLSILFIDNYKTINIYYVVDIYKMNYSIRTQTSETRGGMQKEKSL